MKAIFVLVLVACLASDLCKAANNADGLGLGVGRRVGWKDRGDDYQLGGLLGDPDLIKSLIPKNMDELFELLESFVPGMRQLQAPIQKTWSLLHPVLKDLPDVAEKVLPTLIEIRKALQADEDISDEQFAKWGTALVKDGRPFAKKAIDNFIEAPIEDIIKGFEDSGVVDKIKEFLGEEHKRMLDEAVDWSKKIVDVVLKIKKSLEIISNWESTRMDRKT